MDPDPMLHFACPQLVQKRSPTVVLFQIFSHTFGDEDVTGITTIHNSFARFIPAPAMFCRWFTSATSLIGPL